MTALKEYNPILKTVTKEGLTLELREKNYYILLSNGKITMRGVKLNKVLKHYFGIQ